MTLLYHKNVKAGNDMKKVMAVEKFREIVMKNRKRYFEGAYDFIYKKFIELQLDKKEPKFFMQNASEIIELLREKAWNDFIPLERSFNSDMLKILIDDNVTKTADVKEAIIEFAETYPMHIYSLSLSNTQSRRSRAGKEFEAILELVFSGANIFMDTQGSIGKKMFIQKGLGKLVDMVVPGSVEFTINKRNTVLISSKTTLRERWQEVSEELGKTGAKEMFLATLDETVSKDVLDTLYESNIHLTTTQKNKKTNYNNLDRVVSFEELLRICSTNEEIWEKYNYCEANRNEIMKNINKQMAKHNNKEFLQEYYKKRITSLIK